MVRFSFAGHELAALADGALFWPARRALILADLHFEKASWFASFGQMLPPYDSAATLDAVERLVAQLQPAEIWCLGDSFHDVRGCERLPATEQVRLRTLTDGCRWVWVVGNHDRSIGDPCGGEVIDEALVEGLVLRHEADPADARPELSGHFHPKLRVRVRGKLVSRRCFIATGRKLILPALGALTGGLDVHHPAIVKAIGRSGEALVPVADRLLRFPLAA
ncbi:MAG: ligase-associated DNA damage response endonuclease PdeM [Sphingomonas sp.]|uniref:ligase-associated DNA damage response endonuclease PdeM n=1 Tax=Sphingomonas sp. TaxID=28214 RepID=UPI001AC50755|nr:ligase-associated DNA damage response endonuclease PdeM [Sphingomonas sp.]MBN8809210.1 ligase-associated DNA damage response endonuclease PdeM [Sphingomonas sp.]